MFKFKIKGSSTRGFYVLRRKGFTLIELLVVIFIISLLASIVVVSVSTARAKARDARRIADIDSVRGAMEMYADDSNSSYPTAGTISGGVCTTPATTISGLTPTYLPVIPTDPRNNTTYRYQYCSNGTDYKIFASQMESSDGAAKARDDGGSRGTAAQCTTSPYTSCSYELFSSRGQGF